VLQSVIRKLFIPPPSIPTSPDEAEHSQLQSLAKIFEHDLLFDSNRNGRFGIFRQSLLDNAPLQIVASEKHEMYPDISPCGKRFTFVRTSSLERAAPGEIWIANCDGTDERLIAQNGTFPTFGADSDTIFFERGRNALIKASLTTQVEEQAFPLPESDFGDFKVVKPRISSDGCFASFTSDKRGRWNTWGVELDTGRFWHIAKACEACWRPDTHSVLAIKKSSLWGRTGIYEYDGRSAKTPLKIQDDGPPFGHEYFPTVTRDGKFLLFSSCPIGEHDHLSAHYQLFIRDLSTDVVTRVSFDEFTNRWPKPIPK
jgi:Tol biopolymer transport system component